MQTELFLRHLAQWCLGASGLSQLRLIGPSVKFIQLNSKNFTPPPPPNVRSACKLRARRTEYKSVFFFKRHKLLVKDRGLSGLKGRGFGDSATCRPSEYH